MIEIKVTATQDIGPLRHQIEEALRSIGFGPVDTAGAVNSTPQFRPAAPVETKAEEPKPEPKKKGGKKADKPAISSGEERVGPEDSAETEQQDAADEAAEAETVATRPLTHDDVRKMMGAYLTLYGMPAAQADGPSILGFPKISVIPEEQPALAKAVLAVVEAVEKNPNKHEEVGKLEAATLDNLKEVVALARSI